MSSAQLKERHYQQLASKMQNIARELSLTQQNMVVLAKQLDSMGKLGALHASQFMAVTRLLDAEEVGSARDSTAG